MVSIAPAAAAFYLGAAAKIGVVEANKALAAL
jgi:hypothetical protein